MVGEATNKYSSGIIMYKNNEGGNNGSQEEVKNCHCLSVRQF